MATLQLCNGLAQNAGIMANIYPLRAVVCTAMVSKYYQQNHNTIHKQAFGEFVRMQSTSTVKSENVMQNQIDLVWDNKLHKFVENPGSQSYLKVPLKQPLAHPSQSLDDLPTSEQQYMLMNPVYPKRYVEQVAPRHYYPRQAMDKVAYLAINAVRKMFDWATGYGPNMTEALWLRRIIFLETVAGVPGMVGGMLRHLRSLRDMKRDHGWIHTLLEEAENERMHLLTFLQLRQPGLLFRLAVLIAQGAFFNFYFIAYMMSPRWCHRFVGYLEEEAVKTYTHCLHDIDTGKLPKWATQPCPEIAVQYWKLPEDATIRDLILAVRADEQCHSHVNHTFSSMDQDDTNPFGKGAHIVP